MTRKILMTVGVGLLVMFLFFRQSFTALVNKAKGVAGIAPGPTTVTHPAVSNQTPTQADMAVGAAIGVGANLANSLIDRLFNSGSSVTFDANGNVTDGSSSVDAWTLI